MADLAQSYLGNGIAALAIYLSLVFAYLAAAYIVGKDLTRTQVSILNALFLIFSVITTFGVAAYTNGGIQLSIQSGIAELTGSVVPRTWIAPTIGSVCLGGIVISLKFMGDLRRPNLNTDV
jgi:hypothetical protein